MNTSAKDRETILRAIKRRPGVTIFELVRIVSLPRRFIASTVAQLQRKQVIIAIPLPSRPGINEVRRGYEVAAKQSKSTMPLKHALPAQWDALSLLFGAAAVMP